MGRLLTADRGMAFSPLICMGIAPWGKVLPANMMLREVLFPGKNTVEVGAATLLMVVFLGSEGSGVTATGIAVAYSILPVLSVTVSSFPVFISSRMLEMGSPMGLASCKDILSN